MKDKVFSFLGGFILSLIIIILAVYFFTRQDNKEKPVVREINTEKLLDIKQNTANLTNLGDVPQKAPSDQVGRSNPFDDYK